MTTPRDDDRPHPDASTTAGCGQAPQASEPGTALTSDDLTRLRADAQAQAGPFVDPRRLAEIHRVRSQRHPEWVAAVLGTSRAPATRELTWPQGILLLLAAAAEPDPPTPARVLEHRDRDRAEAAAAAERAARTQQCWLSLATAMPVPVIVAHNYSAQHFDGAVLAADHIRVLAPLSAGRLHRAVRACLCETPRHQLANPVDLDSPTERGRVPDCAACLRLAARLTGIDITPLRNPPGRSAWRA